MQILIDLLPILAFFAAYKLAGIYWATAAAMAIGTVQAAYFYFSGKRVSYILGLNVALVLVFGALTLILRDEAFIKVKPTILYALLAAVFYVAEKFYAKGPMRMAASEALKLPDAVWRGLNYAWILFFLSLAALNLYVVAHFSTDAWVDFKLFGLLGLTLSFGVIQSLWLVWYLGKAKGR